MVVVSGDRDRTDSVFGELLEAPLQRTYGFKELVVLVNHVPGQEDGSYCLVPCQIDNTIPGLRGTELSAGARLTYPGGGQADVEICCQ